MIKVGIDIRSTLKRKTGIGYYTLNLINYLAKVDSQSSYYLYSYIRPFDFKRRLPKLPGGNFHNRLDRLKFQPNIKMKDMDIFHSSSYDIPKFKSTKQITTIHDIIPLVYSEGYPKDVLKGLEDKIKRILDKSDLIVVDSGNTRKDLEAKFSSAGKKIEIVYPGRDEAFHPIEDKKKIVNYLKEKYNLRKEFILFVGTIEKRKNVANLLRAFFDLKRGKKIPHLLVIVGMKGWGGEEAFNLLENSELKEEVKLLGYIQRKDMIPLYNAADLFVYASSYEGFGFPILEAFSCGIPVITSNTTSCGEIAGDAAFTIDPQNTGALKEAIERISADKGLREDLRSKGLKRARLFSWEETARQFQKIFHKVI